MPIDLKLSDSTGVARRGEPVESGLYFAPGAHGRGSSFIVRDEAGRAVPSQIRVLAHHPDTTIRAAHAVFLADTTGKGISSWRVVEGVPDAPVPMLRATADGFDVDTGALAASFDTSGRLTSLRAGGSEILDIAAGPSLALRAGLGPAGWDLDDPRARRVATAAIRENGPVRAILSVRGALTLGDLRGPLELVTEMDLVFYRGRAEIHLAPMLLGAVTESAVIRDWSLALHVRNGREMVYGTRPTLRRQDPNHEHMSWRKLEDGWAAWKLESGRWLAYWSPDLRRRRNGLIRTMVRGEDRSTLDLTVSRIEPDWHYQDVSRHAEPITINRGSVRRWRAVFAVVGSVDGPDGVATRARGWSAPLRAFALPAHYHVACSPWLEGNPTRGDLADRVVAKCREFAVPEGEYAGSLHGGWDGPNGVYLERGVARGEFGEYLLQAFLRGGDRGLYDQAVAFGEIYRDVYCFTLPEASRGPGEVGGARSRDSEYFVSPIRSYRGAVLLHYMHVETGDDRYAAALQARADYHLAAYPHAAGRLSMSVRDTIFLADLTGRPELERKALESARHSLERHFDPVHGFYEDYDESATIPGTRRHPPQAIAGGWWDMADWLTTSNASPEMTAYNIIGWYGLYQAGRLTPELAARVRVVADWFRDRQNTDGSWPYPHDDSRTRWGHGALQDALAMIYAHRMLGGTGYLETARRSVVFARRCFEVHGRIPLLLDLLPHEETEDSLTYYYGLEALALLEEMDTAVR